MATSSDLKDALKHVLAQNGALTRIEAHVQSEIFSALDSGSNEPHINPDSKVDEASFIINELILEYFKFNGLQFSESVFRSEMKHKHEPLSRRLLCQSLNVKPTVTAKVAPNESAPSSEALQLANKPVPLLYYFVEYFKSYNSLDI